MKTPKTIYLSLCCAATLFTSVSHADVSFTDDFNRANTNGAGGGLGADWDAPSTVFVNSNVAKTQTAADQFALYNGFDLKTSFDISVDAYAQSNGRYVGIVFNYTDDQNFYLLRASFADSGTTAWQFLKKDGSASYTSIDSGTITAGAMPLSTYRTISLSSTETAGEYTFSITDLAGTTTYAGQTITDADVSHAVGGQAGFEFSSSFAQADNFAVSTIPEPGTYALLGGLTALFGAAFCKRTRL